MRWADASHLPPALGDGAAGAAVFLATLAATTSETRFFEPAERYLALAAEGIASRLGDFGLGLYGGLTGVAWAETTMARLTGTTAPAGEDIDELLISMLGQRWPGPWELTAGLVGIGTYALDRMESTPALMALVIERLADVRSPSGAWVVDAAALFGTHDHGRPDHYVDLGMAHGLAGLVAFLTLAAAAGCVTARPMLSEASGALLAHQRPSAPAFPALVADAGPVEVPPRWCYGDIGVAGALALGAPLIAHPLVPQALTTILRWAGGEAASRAAAGMSELGLCHGLAGVSQTMHRVAAATGLAHAWEAAQAWGETLVDRLDNDAICDGPGFLTGASGVGLALLSLATDVMPLWDRALLLS